MNQTLKRALDQLEAWVRGHSANSMANMLYPGYLTVDPRANLRERVGRNLHLIAEATQPYQFLTPEQYTVSNKATLQLTVEATDRTCILRCALITMTDFGAFGQISPMKLAELQYSRLSPDVSSESVLELLLQARTVLHQLCQLLAGIYAPTDLHESVMHPTPTQVPSGPAAAVVHVVAEQGGRPKRKRISSGS